MAALYLERELHQRAVAAAAAAKRRRRGWWARLACMALGHRWTDAWRPENVQPMVCARCGSVSGTPSTGTLLGRQRPG